MKCRIQVINYGDAESLQSLGVTLNDDTAILLNGTHSIDAIQSDKLTASGIIDTGQMKMDYLYTFEVGESFKINGVEHQLENILFPLLRLTSPQGSGPYNLVSIIAAKLREDFF